MKRKLIEKIEDMELTLNKMKKFCHVTCSKCYK
jgi:hypothetical protein